MNSKDKNSVEFYSDLSYHLFLYFEWRIHHSIKGGKLLWWIRWRGKLKILIEFLAMRGGVYMRKILFISLCLSSLEQS